MSYPHIDYMKFLMAALIVLLHTVAFMDIAPLTKFAVGHALTRIAVPYFFVASGFFLFRKMRHAIDRAALAHYVRRILRVYILWTILYLPVLAWEAAHAAGGFGPAVRWYLHRALVSGTVAHLWFLYALIIAVCVVAGLLWRGWRLRSVLGLGCACYAVACFAGPEHALYLALAPAAVQQAFCVLEAIFLNVHNGITVGLVFVALGAAIAWRPVPARRTIACGLALSILLFAGEAAWAFRHVAPGTDIEFYFSLVPLAYFLFQATRLALRPAHPIELALRRQSMFLYYAHPLLGWLIFLCPATAVASPQGSILIYPALLAVTLAAGTLLWHLGSRPRLRFLRQLF